MKKERSLASQYDHENKISLLWMGTGFGWFILATTIGEPSLVQLSCLLSGASITGAVISTRYHKVNPSIFNKVPETRGRVEKTLKEIPLPLMNSEEVTNKIWQLAEEKSKRKSRKFEDTLLP